MFAGSAKHSRAGSVYKPNRPQLSALQFEPTSADSQIQPSDLQSQPSPAKWIGSKVESRRTLQARPSLAECFSSKRRLLGLVVGSWTSSTRLGPVHIGIHSAGWHTNHSAGLGLPVIHSPELLWLAVTRLRLSGIPLGCCLDCK